MFCWLLLQIYSSELRLVLCSRVVFNLEFSIEGFVGNTLNMT